MTASKIILFLLLFLVISSPYYSQNSSVNANVEGSRQIHLDFHTSEHIDGIGKDFNKKQFQEALLKAKVNSINIFAKGHHGWSYYPTEVGSIHPGLDFDLLGAQIDACKEIGVRVQAYYTIGWSVLDAIEHPEWVLLDENGEDLFTKRKNSANPDDPMPWGWPVTFPEGPYLDMILAQTEELMEKYALDGIWYDIIPLGSPNYNEWSKKDMESKNIDWKDKSQANQHHVSKTKDFLQKTRDIILAKNPNASVYYNWTTHLEYDNTFDYELHDYNTKIDLEDLPTAWAGYNIFPYRAKYFANTGKEIVAMSGKFHKAWGEFGGFKHKDAIWFEAASMVAFGANANFGDQLHPSGKMDMGTYENIAHAFDYVEKIEAYGIGAEHKSVVGFWFSKDEVRDEGLARMLLENQINFVIASNKADWSDLQAIIIPSNVTLSDADVKRLTKYQADGGKLLVMGKGAFDPKNSSFQLDLGVEYLSDPAYDVDYTLVANPESENLVSTPFLNYKPAIKVKAKGSNSNIVANIREPYFSREWKNFSSHANTPYQTKNAEHPAIVHTGNTVYIAHDLDAMYQQHGARLHRELFTEAFNLLDLEPMVQVDLPSLGRINLMEQASESRYVLHLLYASPIQRGEVRVIEDLIPIFDTKVEFSSEKEIRSIYTMPTKSKVDFIRDGNKYNFTVDKFTGHTVVVIEYSN